MTDIMQVLTPTAAPAWMSDGKSKREAWPDEVADYLHAKTLATLLAGCYRWATHRQKWMAYANGVWRPCGDERMALAASEALRRHYVEMLAHAGDSGEVLRLNGLVCQTCILARVTSALGFLKGWPGFYTESPEWDADLWSLCCANGVLDLRTGGLRSYTPDDLFTKQTGAPFDAGAQCPHWLAHLARFLPSADVRRQVQRALGVALVGATLEESLDLWHGVGKNGKSTTERALLAVLGDYGGVVAPNLLMASKYERHSCELADLSGYRVLFSTETEANRRLAESLVKQVTGGEPIKARFMYGDFFSFERTFSLTLVTNHRPNITGQDLAIWRRIRLIPWLETIAEAEQRPQDEVVAELAQEGGGILAWLVAGLQDWQADHRWMATEVQAATDAYRAEQDALGGFLDDECAMGARFTVGVGELYEAYTAWATQTSEEPLGKKTFSQALLSRGMGQVRTGKAGRRWIGLHLVTDGDTSSITCQEILLKGSSSTSVTICHQDDYEEIHL